MPRSAARLIRSKIAALCAGSRIPQRRKRTGWPHDWHVSTMGRPYALSFSIQGAIRTANVPHRIPSLINSRATKLRVRLNEYAFEPEEPRAEFVKFIAGVLLGFALERGLNAVGFGGIDAAGLAVPNVECAPVGEAGGAGRSSNCRFDLVAAFPRLREFTQRCGKVGHLDLPTLLGVLPTSRCNARNDLAGCG